jgi:hypothetical protein
VIQGAFLMRKFWFLGILLIILPAGAFAQHPQGWGVGVVGQYGFAWDGFSGSPGFALSLKLPRFPLYMSAYIFMQDHGSGFSLTADHYIIDETIIPGINFGWFMGIGAYAGFNSSNDPSRDWTAVKAGARVPVGIYLNPVDFFEVFTNLAPSLGLGYYTGDYHKTFNFPEGGIGLDIGVRFWF